MTIRLDLIWIGSDPIRTCIGNKIHSPRLIRLDPKEMTVNFICPTPRPNTSDTSIFHLWMLKRVFQEVGTGWLSCINPTESPCIPFQLLVCVRVRMNESFHPKFGGRTGLAFACLTALIIPFPLMFSSSAHWHSTKPPVETRQPHSANNVRSTCKRSFAPPRKVCECACSNNTMGQVSSLLSWTLCYGPALMNDPQHKVRDNCLTTLPHNSFDQSIETSHYPRRPTSLSQRILLNKAW